MNVGCNDFGVKWMWEKGTETENIWFVWAKLPGNFLFQFFHFHWIVLFYGIGSERFENYFLPHQFVRYQKENSAIALTSLIWKLCFESISMSCDRNCLVIFPKFGVSWPGPSKISWKEMPIFGSRHRGVFLLLFRVRLCTKTGACKLTCIRREFYMRKNLPAAIAVNFARARFTMQLK